MAYGKTNEPFLLSEGFVEIGLSTDPNTITPSSDPDDAFASDGDIGYFKQGSSQVMIPRTYATFLAGTPGIKVRKDLTLKEFNFQVALAQFTADLLALAQGLLVEDGATTIAWIGPDEDGGTVSPVGFNAYRITTKLTNGTPFKIQMFYGKNTSEEVGWSLTGTEHGNFMLKPEAFPHPSFASDTTNTKSYGIIYFPSSS